MPHLAQHLAAMSPFQPTALLKTKAILSMYQALAMAAQ